MDFFFLWTFFLFYFGVAFSRRRTRGKNLLLTVNREGAAYRKRVKVERESNRPKKFQSKHNETNFLYDTHNKVHVKNVLQMRVKPRNYHFHMIRFDDVVMSTYY